MDGGDAHAIVQLGVGVHDLGSEHAGAVRRSLLGVDRRLNGGELSLKVREVHVREGHGSFDRLLRFRVRVEGCCDDRAAFVEENPGENLKMGL